MINKSLDLTGQSLWKYPLANDTIDKQDINSLIDWLRTNPRTINIISSVALIIIALIAAFIKF